MEDVTVIHIGASKIKICNAMQIESELHMQRFVKSQFLAKPFHLSLFRIRTEDGPSGIGWYDVEKDK